jgi:tRNA modification GTPase
MRRARAELARADLVLAMLDAGDPDLAGAHAALAAELPADVPVLWLHNKCDAPTAPAPPAVGAAPAGADSVELPEVLRVSARTGAGLEALRARLHAAAGGADTQAGGGTFSARARHVDALDRAGAHLAEARARLATGQAELSAEDLRLAHAALGEITGAVDADQLLGRIFAGFCIGK